MIRPSGINGKMTNRESRLATKNRTSATNGLINKDSRNGDINAPAIGTIALIYRKH